MIVHVLVLINPIGQFQKTGWWKTCHTTVSGDTVNHLGRWKLPQRYGLTKLLRIAPKSVVTTIRIFSDSSAFVAILVDEVVPTFRMAEWASLWFRRLEPQRQCTGGKTAGFGGGIVTTAEQHLMILYNPFSMIGWPTLYGILIPTPFN